MDRLLSSLVFFITLCVVSATYSPCDSPAGSISILKVTDCNDDDATCVLKRNTNVTIEITFVPKEDITTVKAVVHGYILDIPVPFNLPNPDGCKDSGLTCPLKSGQTYVYYTSLPILKKYPKVTVDVKFELQTQSNEDIACAKIPSKIQ